MHRGLPIAAMSLGVLSCTANFWSLRTGVLGGEAEGDVATTFYNADGCNDMTVFAVNEDATAMLTLTMTGPISQMHDDRDRLKTLLLDDPSDFTLTLQVGRDLYSLPCQNEYYYYYGYYGGYGGGEAVVRKEFEYTSGDLRLSITARKKRWEYYYDPVHAKLWMDDVVLTDPTTGETVSLSSTLIQTYVWQWYWY